VAESADAQPHRRVRHGDHRFCRAARAPFPSRRLGLDSATLLLAFAVEFIYLVAYLGVQGYAYETFPLAGLLAWTAVKLLKLSIYLLIAALLAEAILSWVNPHTPVAPLLAAVNRPFVQPLRRSIPPLGRVDLSVLVLFIICQLILIVPIGGMEQAVMRLL